MAGMSVHAYAQPRLDGQSLPKSTNLLDYSNCDTLGVTPGAAGNNVSWNFFALRMKTPFQAQFLARQGLPPQVAAAFPTAMTAFVQNGRYTLYTMQGNFLRTLGTWDSPQANVSVASNNPFDTRPQELTLGSQHQDTYNGTVISPTAIGRRTGSWVIRYDGYGTLELPTKAIGDVVRTNSIHTTLDTMVARSNARDTTFVTTITTTYQWQARTSCVPELQIITTSVTTRKPGGPATTGTTKSVFVHDSGIPSGIPDTGSLPPVWPQPANSKGMLHIGTDAVPATVSLVSLTGQALPLEWNMFDGGMLVTLCAASPGMYTVLITSATGSVLPIPIVIAPQ